MESNFVLLALLHKQVEKLLKGGIRAFDFRPGFYSKTETIDGEEGTTYYINRNHGISKTEITMEAAFTILSDYLKEHPSEFFDIFDKRSGNHLLQTTFVQGGIPNYVGNNCYINNGAANPYKAIKADGLLHIRMAKPLATADGKQNFFFDNFNLMYHGPKGQSAIESVAVDNIEADTLVDVYNVSGMTVRMNVPFSNALDTLPKGIYLVRAGEKVMKTVK